MTITNTTRKLLDRKQTEFCSPLPNGTAAGHNISSSRLFRQMQYLMQSAATTYEYLPEEDAYIELPAAGIGGIFAAGACSSCTPYSIGYMTTPNQIGAPLQSTSSGAGTTTTIVTLNNYGVNALVGYQVRCVSGTAANIGQVRAVASNTATTITLAVAFSSATALGDQFALEPIVSVTAGAASTTTVITAISAVNNQAIGTVGNLVASALITYQIRCTQAMQASAANQGLVRWITANTTNSITVGVAFPVAPSTGDVFVIEPYNTATASGAGTTTTVVTTNTWPINCFSGFQLRPLTGTAANLGQPRLILSNTATTITLQSALPGATATSDTFVIEPVVFGQELTYNGTATTGGSTTTIPVTGTPWVAGQWGDSYQVRVLSGTGVGCIRQVTNNTSSVLTVVAPLTAVPDATTKFIIEPVIAYSQTTSVATNQTLARDLRGFKLRVQTSTSTWEERTIAANTIGRNGVITLTQAFSQAPVSAPSLTSAIIAATSAGTATTIVTTNSWQTNALVGYQVRPLSGTAGNLGAIRTVVSNTATTLTLSVALPSATASADTFELDYAQLPVINTVTSTGAGTVTTIVTGSAWTVNVYTGCFVRAVSGASPGNIGQVRTVLSNTATTLTLDSPLPSATTTADVFELLDITGKTTTASGAGSTTTVVTTNTWSANAFAGYQVRALSGTAGNIGCVRTIASNTATTLTLAAAFPSATATSDVFVIEPVSSMYTASAFQLQTTRWWIWNAHTAVPVASQFRFYDYALNLFMSTGGFSAAAVGGVPPVGAAWGTDGCLVATPSIVDTANQIFDTFTATSGTATSVTCAARNWGVRQWSNYQIRIISGTGVGQVRWITDNTQTVLYTTTWSIVPDATSVFVIEGNDDNLYLLGNAAVTMFRFSISSGAWITLAPVTARGGATGAGCSGHWVWSTAEPNWADSRNIVSGRRIYSFRGGASAALDYYDIALNTWVASPYAPAAATFTTGAKYNIVSGRYLFILKDGSNRIYRFNFAKQEMDPMGQFLFPQGAAVVGQTSFDASIVDGNTTITWLYINMNTSNVMLRMMII